MKKVIFWGIMLLIAIAIFGVSKMTGNIIAGTEKVEIQTSEGNIIVELYQNKAPITVENFKSYIQEGFYDGTIFHRVIDGFMIQGGGYIADKTEKETHTPIKLESKNGLSNKRGTIAMARTNVPDSATSQFFINSVDNDFLDYGVRDDGYAVFGKVIEGMDVVDKISKVPRDGMYWPTETITIISVRLI